MRVIGMFCALVGLLALAAAPAGAAPLAQGAPPHTLATDQIIVKFKPAAMIPTSHEAALPERLAALGKAAGVGLAYGRAMSGDAHVYKLPSWLPEDQVQAVANRLARLLDVEYAGPDRIMLPTLIPNDQFYTNQWPLSGTFGIKAQEAWDITTGSNTLIVAVLDTGVRFDHRDLAGRLLLGYDFITIAERANDGDGRDADASDPGDWVTTAESTTFLGPFWNCRVDDSSWHGTNVAGHIGAATNNTFDVSGIDWNARILPVRVLGKCGGMTSDIVDAIRWAAGLPILGVPNNGSPARVINLSLGSIQVGGCDFITQSAIDAARAQGAVVVVSAGNDGVDASQATPASCNGVITVAATDASGNRSIWDATASSNFGGAVEISAPGSAGITTSNLGTRGPGGNSVGGFSGTSMAAPHVAGTASLLLAVRPELTPDQVLQQLQGTTTSFPASSTCAATCGSGIVNAYEAVSSLFVTQGFAGGLGLPQQPYGSFTDAYNRAWPGARLKLRAATYTAPMLLDRRIELIAVDGPVVIGR
jgi:serine protease